MARLTWYDHSCFKIEAAGARVIIDPFFPPHGRFRWEDIGKVDLVLLTHDHGDHVGNAVEICNTYRAMLGCIVGTGERMHDRGIPTSLIFNEIGINIGGTITCKGIKALMTQAFHTSDTGAPAGYIVTMPDGLVFYHAGDTGIFSSMSLLANLYNPTLLLLPIGGIFTMDGFQAAHACKLMQAPRVIPMHWGTFPSLAQSPDEFKKNLAEIYPECQCIDPTPGVAMEIHP